AGLDPGPEAAVSLPGLIEAGFHVLGRIGFVQHYGYSAMARRCLGEGRKIKTIRTGQSRGTGPPTASKTVITGDPALLPPEWSGAPLRARRCAARWWRDGRPTIPSASDAAVPSPAPPGCAGCCPAPWRASRPRRRKAAPDGRRRGRRSAAKQGPRPRRGPPR